ncbi:TIGR04283 family arsenosugar biosynthesis glycosyltransferase [Altibacter sp.]|uniref:TIGR04283 family arsenosugar biosynthesis glycosyltransferase n=1 Tax=Altibacter sp. TaxID=2024823 RepID=UPI000C939A7C|nr:TIGR04283 family arsenosugar biosynthesis glycosyltransferase [Altibacter sp.]MAP55303.1 glycosyl transferase family 2 [Altibacter sp.]
MISIIIPVLNEAQHIRAVLSHLTSHASPAHVTEILVVDGGSTDDTVAITQRFSETSSLSVSVIPSEKGRAKQMNNGAKKANGSVLYFLHADSLPPKQFDTFILEEVAKGHPAGCFKMRFDSNHWWLQFVGWFTRFSWRACRGGDQSLFITKQLFFEIGGFDERYIIYEDNILINELYARKTFSVIPHALTSSARLYREKGVWFVQYHFLMIYCKKWLGADAEALYQYYCKHLKGVPKVAVSSSNKPKEIFVDR